MLLCCDVLCDPVEHLICFPLLHLRFDALQSMAKSLMSNPRHSGEVKEQVKTLSAERQALKEAAEARSSQLLQCHQLQLFYRDAEQVDGTTANQEAFLANEDLGVRCT